MSNYLRFFLLGIFLLAITGCTAQHAKETVFYVSLPGNDNNPGTETKPFATLEKARDAVRELKKSDSLPEGGFTIYIRAGLYTLSETFALSDVDSGTKTAPITWCAYPGEQVTISGGKPVIGFKPVEDTEILKRFDKAGHGKVLETDLKSLGITGYEDIDMQVFFNGVYTTRARYPNEGWLTITDVPQHGKKLMYIGDVNNLGATFNGIPAGRHYGRFTYDGDRPKQWADTENIWMRGFWCWDWRFDYQKVKKINVKKREIFTEEPYHGYGYRKGQRFFFLNIFDELDSPGEWYVDAKSGILYFWPPAPINSAIVMIPILKDTLFSLDKTEYVTISGINFTCSRGSAITVSNCKNSLIAGCAFTNFGKTVVTINGGTNNGITSSDINEVAQSGIYLRGGDRKTLTPSGNFASNNHAHHFSRDAKTGATAISLNGVGNRIANNLIHDAPHHAMNFGGNENIIEFNEIHSVVKETGDAGSVYAGRDWSQRGNIIRHNYWHDIYAPELEGPAFTHVMSMYLDDMYSGATIFGNIFHNVEWAVLIGGGHDNTVENNLFVNCDLGISGDMRSLSWGKIVFAKGGSCRMWKRLEEVPYKEEPWRSKYPKLVTILDSDPLIPSGNRITRNVAFGGTFLLFIDGAGFEQYEVSDNLIVCPTLINWQKKIGGNRKEFKYGDKKLMKTLQGFGNIVSDTDPGVVDAEHGDFTLKEESDAWKLGFKPIPFDKIGLYVDEYRASLPGK